VHLPQLILLRRELQDVWCRIDGSCDPRLADWGAGAARAAGRRRGIAAGLPAAGGAFLGGEGGFATPPPGLAPLVPRPCLVAPRLRLRFTHPARARTEHGASLRAAHDAAAKPPVGTSRSVTARWFTAPGLPRPGLWAGLTGVAPGPLISLGSRVGLVIPRPVAPRIVGRRSAPAGRGLWRASVSPGGTVPEIVRHRAVLLGGRGRVVPGGPVPQILRNRAAACGSASVSWLVRRSRQIGGTVAAVIHDAAIRG
jgi:hypothetical protein